MDTSKIPWKWVGGGAALLAVGLLLSRRGGGGGGDGGDDSFDIVDIFVPDSSTEMAPEFPDGPRPEIPAGATSYGVELASWESPGRSRRVELLEIHKLGWSGWRTYYVVNVYETSGKGLGEYLEATQGDWSPELISASGEFGVDEYQAARNYYETMRSAAEAASK